MACFVWNGREEGGGSLRHVMVRTFPHHRGLSRMTASNPDYVRKKVPSPDAITLGEGHQHEFWGEHNSVQIIPRWDWTHPRLSLVSGLCVEAFTGQWWGRQLSPPQPGLLSQHRGHIVLPGGVTRPPCSLPDQEVRLLASDHWSVETVGYHRLTCPISA